MTITLTVSGRIASVDATAHVVAGNTYPVALSLDSEWTGSLYLRVRFGSLYYDIPFASSDASVDVQMPVGYPEVGIGVFSEALEICSCEARIRLLRSILEAGEQVVEFDSDLYDQWAGEVSELLCDDAFDAESDRPVKNSVITAWKDTVPLDSALVHKAGAETITGAKTFTSDPKVTRSTALLTLESTQASSVYAWKGRIMSSDQHNGVSTAFADILFGNLSAGNYVSIRAMNPSRDGTSQALAVYNHGDHMSVQVTAPYYPVDGSSNPQPLPATHVETSGNVAVDPRIVHTTGNEIIAGEKTFTGNTTLQKSNEVALIIRDTRNYGTSQVKGGLQIYCKNANGNDANLGSVSLFQSVSAGVQRSQMQMVARNTAGQSATLILSQYEDGHADTESPSYTPVDSDGNHLVPNVRSIINSTMLAVDPRVVHTTGSETIAGDKTFSGTLNAPKIRSASVIVQMVVNTWYKMYTITPVSVGQQIFLEIFNTSSISSLVDAKLRIQVPNSSWPYDPAGNLFNVGSILVGKLAKTADGKLEVWLCKVSGSTQHIMFNAEYLGSLIPTPVGTSGDEPVQGDDYPLVKNITVVS